MAREGPSVSVHALSDAGRAGVAVRGVLWSLPATVDRYAGGMTEIATPPPIQEGGVDLLGVRACGERAACDRMSEDARAAPSLASRAALSEMAAAEMGHYAKIERFLAARGIDVE